MEKNKIINLRFHLLKKCFIVFLLLLSIICISGVRVKAASKTIHVGWVDLPGIQEYEDGVYSGYSYDYLMEVAKYTGWTYEFSRGNLTDVLSDLSAGNVDIVGGLLYSAARAELYDFPNSDYGKSYLSLFTSINSPLEKYDFDSFDGIRIGMVDNATVNIDNFAQYALENDFSFTPVYYTDATLLSEAVIKGEVDAGMRGAYRVEEDTKILAEFSPSSLYFAVTKGNSDVLVGLNRAINQIQIDNPYLQIELYKKYFDVKSAKLTDAEIAIVEASKTTPITVGVVDNSAPLLYYNSKTEKYEGISIDILNLAAEKTGLKINYVPVDISRSSSATTPTEDSPKIVVGVTKMDALTDLRGWYLSDSLISDNLVMIGRRGNDLSKKENKTIAVMNGFSVAEQYVNAYLTDYTIVKYDNLNDCLKAVADGKVDASIYINSCNSYLLQKPQYEKLEVLPTYSNSDIDMVIAAFVEENNDIIDILNKGLALITDEENRNIILNYTVMNPYEFTISDTLYKYRTPIIIIGILVILVIGVLVLLYVFIQKSSKAIKKAYEQEKEALAIAENASIAKGNFMSRMSHEIRTPLNAIIGYNTIASNDIIEAKTETDYRQTIMKIVDCLTKSSVASKHLLTIINDVLDMSAIESGKIKIAHERFDFKGLINSLTTIFYSQAKSKEVEFEVLFATMTEEWFVGDQMRTNQILTNILSNAIKFTSEGGKVVLSIKQPDAENDAAHILFEITDTGIGMSNEYLKNIWTPFEQADSSISRRFGGTGLGMSITKSLVDLMGGTIEVQSELGKGSTFTVNLTFDKTEQPGTSDSYDFSKVNALVIDDDPSTCDYIRLLMNRFGARCTSALSGYEALDTIVSSIKEEDPYTVCLVDWRMPKMDGLETIKRIREIVGRNMPIIVITAYDFSEIIDKAAEYGITKFISKPLFQSSLFNLLANICGLQAKKVQKKNQRISFNGERILLAEDNDMNQEIAKSLLEASGLVVDTAINGEQAVRMFEQSEPGTYCAILMDIQMPVMDGYQATKYIRISEHSEATSIPIIAMTADAFAENVAEALLSGMNAHIAKPIDITVLYETIKKYIDQSK